MNRNNFKPPTPAQIKFLKANIDTMAFGKIVQQFKIDEPTLLDWCKIAYREKPKKTMTPEDVVEYELASVNQRGEVVARKTINSPLRKFYLVTFDHAINFVVKLSRPVPHCNVMYAPSSVGCDYEVYPLGIWEYEQLEKKVPVIFVDVTPNYARSFWLQLKLALNEA